MTLGDWMLTLLLLYLPIVNIVMLIIWSVDSKTSTTKKHFAWATLIFMAIGIILSDHSLQHYDGLCRCHDAIHVLINSHQ